VELIGAFAAAVAMGSLILAIAPRKADPGPRLEASIRGVILGRLERSRDELAKARLSLEPRTFLALQLAAPVVLAALGLVLSAPLAVLGLIVGLLAPRWYVRYLTGVEARAAEDDAPRVLRAMVNRAAAGGVYPDLFAAAAEAAVHRWVKADFNEVLGRYFASEAPSDALAEIRRRQAGRNLALVYDALIVLTRTHQPVSAAGEVLSALGEAARSNQRVARSAAAESRGLRMQAGFLAVVIPGLFGYLLLANHDLVAPVLDTGFGRFVLLPVAACLEFAGIWLSWRVTRLEV
jgi:Flp pilus assembly protein TadB